MVLCHHLLHHFVEFFALALFGLEFLLEFVNHGVHFCSRILTSKNESVDRLVPTYLSSMESGVTMRDSCTSLSDRRISDVPRRISDVPRQISDRSPTSDIADKFGSQIVLRTEKGRVEINPYNSLV